MPGRTASAKVCPSARPGPPWIHPALPAQGKKRCMHMLPDAKPNASLRRLLSAYFILWSILRCVTSLSHEMVARPPALQQQLYSFPLATGAAACDPMLTEH
eukprot:904348-Pelagomonas_calceolata.AAC.5